MPVSSAVLPVVAPNRVPRVTVDFWLIKLLAVTVGETAADYLAVNLGLGLSMTSWIMTGLLVIAILLQFAQRKYVPAYYWFAVVAISVVGTLVSDNLVDGFGVALRTTTIAFMLILAVVFIAWQRSEHTLSIHSIVTTRREIYYWLAILFTFALGTSAGDWMAEAMELGYLETGVIFAGLILAIGIAYFVFRMNSILAFWLAYIFTRPLGASFGDLLSQPMEYGGLGLGTTVTSFVFLGCIMMVVLWMSLNRRPLSG